MKLNNLQVSSNDLNGRRFNGTDLQLYLKELGLNSQHLVWHKQSLSIDTTELTVPENKHYNDLMMNVHYRYSAQSQFNPFSYELLFDKNFLEADVVHYHLIHNHFFSIAHLPILTKLKPTVWTLHDPWAITGHCIHPFDCEKWKTGCGGCPDLNADFAIRKDTTALNWKLKEIYFSKSNFDIIVASQWMYDRVSVSPLLKDKCIHIVPFGLNLNVFKVANKKKLREKFGIPYDNFVICLRAIQWGLKGFEYTKELLKLLNNLSKRITIVSYNEVGLLVDFNEKFQIIDLGTIYEEDKLADMYGVSDIFVSTSLAESFGLSALESIACGTPVVAFDGTAITEVIQAPYAGIVVPPTDIYAMKSQIENIINDEILLLTLSNNARKLAESKYSKDDYVSKVVSVYNQVIKSRGFDSRSKFIVTQQQNVLIERENKGSNMKNSNINQFNEVSSKLSDVLNSRTFIIASKLKNNVIIRSIYFGLLRPIARIISRMR